MSFFSVKNYEKFQHYKDRAPPWIKLYNELLDDYEFGQLPDASKMHLIAIWLLASRSENKIPYDPEWVARRVNATEPVNLELLASKGFILLDQALQTVEQVASNPLAKCLSRERGETEGETEKRKEDSEAKASAANGTFEGSDEDQFWSLVDPAAKAGIARSRLGQLVKFSDGDFRAALSVLKSALRKKEPAAYLGKALASMRDETKLDAAVEARDPSIPEFVHNAKAEGMSVKRCGDNWEIGRDTFNPEGRMIGF